MKAIEQALINSHGLGKNGGTSIYKINSISALRNPTEYELALIRGAELPSNSGIQGAEITKRARIGDVIQVFAS